MALIKDIKNRSGVVSNFININKVIIINNGFDEDTGQRINELSVTIEVSIFLNKGERNQGSLPVDRRSFNFQIPRNTQIGRLRRFAVGLLKTTDLLQDAVEDTE